MVGFLVKAGTRYLMQNLQWCQMCRVFSRPLTGLCRSVADYHRLQD